jgi:hypothetical protein
MEQVEKKDLKGIRGWLILVAIGVVLSPIRMLAVFVPLYQEIFTNGTWEALTTTTSEVYHPMWAPLLIGELGFNALMFAASIYLIYLFFSKHYLFPKVYIILVVISLVFIPLDAWFVSFIMPEKPIFDPETLKEFVRTLIVGMIWIPYMLISKRVKATFVEKLPEKESY